MLQFLINKTTVSAVTPVRGVFLAGLIMQQELTNT